MVAATSFFALVAGAIPVFGENTSPENPVGKINGIPRFGYGRD
jgi:hypothetical protein